MEFAVVDYCSGVGGSADMIGVGGDNNARCCHCSGVGGVGGVGKRIGRQCRVTGDLHVLRDCS
eukprot:m.129714 g.129714  ORF g.129714 m.129714 type:complete len:63 (-) comp13050_c6_seq1:2043-2231(-)